MAAVPFAKVETLPHSPATLVKLEDTKVQTRYIGSDQLLQRQAQAQEGAGQAALAASDRIGKATTATINTIVQGQASLSQLSTAQAEAEARASASQTGLSGFAEAAGRAVVSYKRAEDQAQAEAQARAKAQAEAEAAKLKQTRAQNKVRAAEELAAKQLEYENSNWQNGVYNYKSETAKILAKYDLEPQDLGELFTKVNSRAVERSQQTAKALDDEVQKLQNTKAAAARDQLLMATSADYNIIKTLPPFEQARPYLENLETKLENFMKAEDGLTFQQKLDAVSAVRGKVVEAMEGKGESYAKAVATQRAHLDWVNTYNQLNAAQASGQISEAEFRSQVLALETRTGVDLSKYMARVGDEEKRALELGGTIKGLNDLNESARKQIGQTFDFGDKAGQVIAAGILSTPGLQQQLENNPYLKDNPSVKAGIEFAKQIQALYTDLADLGVDRASANKELATLDLSNTRNVVEVTRSIIRKQNSGQTLSPGEQKAMIELQLLRQTYPQLVDQIGAVAQSQSTGKAAADEVKALEATIRQESVAIESAKQQTRELYKAKVDAVYQKHATIISVFGGVPTGEQLTQFYQSGQQELNQRLQQFQQQLQQTPQSVSPVFGQQPNFNAAGGDTGVLRQPNGRYVVAPKTRLQVQTKSADGGTPFITPIQAGVSAPHSFNKGQMGGGYKAGRGNRQHAGVDFPLAGGQKAMTVVSGTVLYVGTANGYGGYVDVAGDNGYVYRYAHVSPYVRKGQRLGAGEAVATPNGSGVGGHHLHFEVWKGDEYFKRVDKSGKGAWGISGTIDPVAHLRQLTELAGTEVGATTTALRGQATFAASTSAPFAKVSNKTLFTPGGGALQANLFQQLGKPTQNASRVFTAQRPLNAKGGNAGWSAGKPTYNYNDDMGFAFIRNNRALQLQIHATARRLGVPSVWIADIMAQESGAGRLARKIHPGSPNQNYGLFGFGSDSGVPNWTSLDEVQQVKAYENYILKNGWNKVIAKNGGNVNIGQLWAMTRMGTNWRNQILNGRDPSSLKLNDTGKTYADELRLLGNHVGREYAVPGGSRSERAGRNKGVRRNRRASSNTAQAIASNNSFDLLARDLT